MSCRWFKFSKVLDEVREIVDAIIQAIENNRIESIIIVGMIVSFIWLFKEQRVQYIEIRKENTDKTREALVIYAQLYDELKDYNDTNLEKVEEIYQRAIPYLPKESLRKYLRFKDDNSEESYSELKQDIQNEIYRLKGLQRDTISYRQDNYLDTMEYLIYTSRLDTFIKPLLHTFTLFFLAVCGILFFVTLITNEIDYKMGIDVFTKILSIILLFIVFLFIMELIEKKKFKHTLFNWFINVLLFLTVIILAVLKTWYLGLISISIVCFYLFYLMKFGQKNS